MAKTAAERQKEYRDRQKTLDEIVRALQDEVRQTAARLQSEIDELRKMIRQTAKTESLVDAVASREPGRGKVSLPVKPAGEYRFEVPAEAMDGDVVAASFKPAGKSKFGLSEKLLPRK